MSNKPTNGFYAKFNRVINPIANTFASVFFPRMRERHPKLYRAMTAMSLVAVMVAGAAYFGTKASAERTRSVAPASFQANQAPTNNVVAAAQLNRDNNLRPQTVELMRSNDPHGVKFGCSPKIKYYTMPYMRCRVLLQPGDVQEHFLNMASHPSTYGTVITGMFALICTTGGPVLMFVCGTIGAVYADKVYNAFKAAAKQRRCVQVTFEWLPTAPGIPSNFRVAPFGAGMHWVYTVVHFPAGDDYVRQWLHTDDCQYYGGKGGPVII